MRTYGIEESLPGPFAMIPVAGTANTGTRAVTNKGLGNGRISGIVCAPSTPPDKIWHKIG